MAPGFHGFHGFKLQESEYKSNQWQSPRQAQAESSRDNIKHEDTVIAAQCYTESRIQNPESRYSVVCVHIAQAQLVSGLWSLSSEHGPRVMPFQGIHSSYSSIVQ
ncbi:unnamed protein product [Ambrosiozyma monospora]|uniref:Unnamed protein product n=1 Tax=Ambrosiozyma monospora TaxID=43982 RepID=A0A9W6WKT6_AMBMO|nr:unnamed protein product [Ambrosiozyma monospora]